MGSYIAYPHRDVFICAKGQPENRLSDKHGAGSLAAFGPPKGIRCTPPPEDRSDGTLRGVVPCYSGKILGALLDRTSGKGVRTPRAAAGLEKEGGVTH